LVSFCPIVGTATSSIDDDRSAMAGNPETLVWRKDMSERAHRPATKPGNLCRNRKEVESIVGQLAKIAHMLDDRNIRAEKR
jgi:hypothetical protein